MSRPRRPDSAPPPGLSRRAFLAATGALALGPRLGHAVAPGARPSPAQLRWQREELALFLHFGVNTFTDREWGDGREDPAIFHPAALDAREWARTARAAGFRLLILTAKHHDGFCLWPSAVTRHSVAASPWRGGSGDLVREFADAARAEGLGVGLYCSPWDRNAGVYGDSPRYNDFYCDQLTELLTRYGPVREVWFDGANGEGPDGRKQQYDWPRFFGLVRRLQPGAVMFSDAGPDLRWIGNEQGEAGDPNWSPVDPARVRFPGDSAPGVTEALLHGDPDGTVWRPGETDTSIRPGWFHHPAEDASVRTVDQLVQLYFTSVGRNSKLLLNVPPTATGQLHPTDVARLAGMRAALDGIFQQDLVAGRHWSWRRTGPRSAQAEIAVGGAGAGVQVGIADLREDIESGQRVARYTLDAHDGERWRTLSSGSTIGCRKLDRFPPQLVRRLRLRLEATIDTPRPLRIALHAGA